MQYTIISSTLRGVDAVPVNVEVDLATGMPSFTTVGLAEVTVREARVRVQSAIINSGFIFPIARITLNLAPAHLKKDGTGFDLPIALALLAASGSMKNAALSSCAALGELSLTGDVRPVRGALSAAEAAVLAGCDTLLVAPENAEEAALVHGVTVRAVRTLADAVAFLSAGQVERAPVVVEAPQVPSYRRQRIDLSDVKGQFFARRALEVAAAGGHNLIFFGGPGSGKTMLARRLPGILPPLSRAEALEITRVHSVAGLTIGTGLLTDRPFRAPHHSTTPPGLVGGGQPLRPGEVSLAHHGVLFLDELPEFARPTLEVLREPLESGEVMLSRANGTLRYPANTILVASMNPCPCGYFGTKRCRCSGLDVHRYQSKISGPLLDRIDMHVSVPPVDLMALDTDAPGESTESVLARVVAARDRQLARQGDINARLHPKDLEACARPDDDGRKVLMRAVEKLALSARGYDRVRRVARTIADLEGSVGVHARHVAEALQYRGSEPKASPQQANAPQF